MHSVLGFYRSAFILFLILIPVHSDAFEGPLQVRNQFPILTFVDPPYLESAAVQDSATVALTHSSVYVTEQNAAWTVNMDLELTELMIRLKKKLNAQTEVGLDLPFYRPTAGFLDSPVASIHDFLGTDDYGRHQRPDNQFLYEVLYQGRPVIVPKDGESGIGDLRLTAKRVVLEGQTLVSVLANVEFPTGDVKTGHGNGSYDATIAVLVDMDLGKVYRGYANLGVVFPGDLKGYQTIPLKDYAYGGFGVEAAWWEHFHMIVQTVVATSPYPTTDIRQVDWPGVLLILGGRYTSGSNSVEFSFAEDPDTAGAPDFILSMAYRYAF